MCNNLQNAFCLLSTEAKELYIPQNVDCSRDIPSPLDFLRHYVSRNLPLLIKGGARHWPAMKKWDRHYLKNILHNKKVTVAVTPNGYADAIATKLVNGEEKQFFVLPEERTMSISDFFSKLHGGSEFSDPSVRDSHGVFYLQKQNSNLTEEFPELLGDIDTKLHWAKEAFGEEPSAVNLWIGDKRSVTSLHKDPFENIYAVVRGWKEFILIPPTDRPWLPYKSFPVASYLEKSPGEFEICVKDEMEDGSPTTVPWITIDPVNPDLRSHPSYENANPVKVRVGPGDLLYLPSYWFHHVQQSDGCIAVNLWYDMCMDIKYAYFQFLDHLCRQSCSEGN